MRTVSGLVGLREAAEKELELLRLEARSANERSPSRIRCCLNPPKGQADAPGVFDGTVQVVRRVWRQGLGGEVLWRNTARVVDRRVAPDVKVKGDPACGRSCCGRSRREVARQPRIVRRKEDDDRADQ